jgi:ribonucleoside-diphosphate reductase alpha chain
MIFEQNVSLEVFTQKYMINGEKDSKEVFKGVAEEIASVEKEPLKWAPIFYEAISEGYLLPGGRILANARPSTKLKQYNNCFTIPIQDSLQGIYQALMEDALISGTGGGVGFNISHLRPKNEPTSKGGVSSGPISFLKVFNESAKIIQTGGARRAAHICIMNVDHPDIEEFITCKQGDTNGVLTQFNISVGITDAFIDAVEKDLDWDLKFEGKVYKTVKAKDLYTLLAQNAFIHNEPGILNLDHVNKWNTGYWAFDIEATNPCGEICLSGNELTNTPTGPLTMLEIHNKILEGEEVYVLSYDIKNQVKEYKRVENSILTKKNADVIKVVVQEGPVEYEVTCTPDHKFYTRNRGYIEARYLTSDDDIITNT